MKRRTSLAVALGCALPLTIALLATAREARAADAAAPPRPQGPCDVYAAAGAPCVAAHSTTRALFAAYNGPLYQVLRYSDGKTLDIGVVQPSASPVPDAGGYADASSQDAFCASTHCWIAIVYDQSPKHNDLIQAPRGGFSGPAMGGFNNLPIADMAPVTVMGHKVYGVFIAPGMGLRQNDAKGTAVDDQAEGQYWVINGHHYNDGCCFDYGNAETDSRDDDNGTMETTYFGNARWWYHGNPPGPWIMTDQENNLVGCVNADGSKLCRDLPDIGWRFVTAMAKGEPHHWTALGGDAQRGAFSVMFDGPRVDFTYDPMRKQGAILLGNGGDNSNGSQGTFYEGAMTAAGTFPSDATDQLVQANIVAARYDVAMLRLAPVAAASAPPGLQTFTPGSEQDTEITFTNTTGAPVTGLQLRLAVPAGWTAVAAKDGRFPGPIAEGESVKAAFKVTSGATDYNGDVLAQASWTNRSTGQAQTGSAAGKVRNVPAVKINEFRASGGAPNPTDAFIELYNSGSKGVDISGWSLTEHAAHLPAFSTVKIPAGTKLAPKGFYLLGLANSGLAIPARAGDSTIHVRSTVGLSVGDALDVDAGAAIEKRTIMTVGTAAGNPTTLWQPVPDGPVIAIPVGSTNVPVTSVAGFKVGEKIALGYGASFPNVARDLERYEVATVTAIGKPGTQAYLGTDAPVGATNIKVTSVDGISTGDRIRLDIDSPGHGIETVTVTKVGTHATRVPLLSDAVSGATNLKVRSVSGFTVGDRMTIGTPATQETVTITAVGTAGAAGSGVDFAPALAKSHPAREDVVAHGTGLDLAAPLTFNHAANMPFSVRGTGITFQPATAFAHTSNEPIQPLGTGIVLDKPLNGGHAIDAAVRAANVTTAGYQGSPAPQQWFGGPALSATVGSMVLRDADGLIVDSLNYGGLVDPWISQGSQERSGAGQNGCFVPAPAFSRGFGPQASGPGATSRSAGRFPDGQDTHSNCDDFLLQPATTLAVASAGGATNIKVTSVTDLHAGDRVLIGAGADMETAVVAAIGTPGGTTLRAPAAAGGTVIPVAVPFGFREGQAVIIDTGENAESATIVATNFWGGATITVAAPLARAHASGVPFSGTGITFTAALAKAHGNGTQVARSLPTPGAPNRYFRSK